MRAHTALVYSDMRQRNRLIESILEGDGVRWGRATVLSSHPESDREYFGRAKGARVRSPPPSVYDMNTYRSKGRDLPAEELLAILREGERRRPGAPAPLVVGDWVHLYYDRFEVIDRDESGIQAESLDPICCYRQEGFWSLDPKQIVRVFETHDRVVCAGATVRMNG